VSKGEPTDEKLVQDYTSKWYQRRYSGSGFLYHSRIVTNMLSGIKFRDGRYSDRVLDVGCGTGFVSQLYPNFDITGIDISDGMLERNPYKWTKASAESIPFPNDHFDFVVCRSLLHHLDDPKIGLEEMFRVLKPGGQFSCWDPHHNVVYETVRHIFQHTDRFSHLHHSFNAEELFGMIEEAGFEITEKRYIGYIAYPTIGFPDILNFHIPVWLGRKLMALDDLIARTPFKKFSWSLMVKAVKK
jgi:ubiquinone/menaquinone biosynthesis C-methylase UbiE